MCAGPMMARYISSSGGGGGNGGSVAAASPAAAPDGAAGRSGASVSERFAWDRRFRFLQAQCVARTRALRLLQAQCVARTHSIRLLQAQRVGRTRAIRLLQAQRVAWRRMMRLLQAQRVAWRRTVPLIQPRRVVRGAWRSWIFKCQLQRGRRIGGDAGIGSDVTQRGGDALRDLLAQPALDDRGAAGEQTLRDAFRLPGQRHELALDESRIGARGNAALQ